MSIPGQYPHEKLLDPCVAEYSVVGRTRREACGSMCKILLLAMVKNTGKVNNWQTGILRARQMSTPVNGRGLRSVNNIQRA